MKPIVIDAANQSFGRLASAVAWQLQGKDRPEYQPNSVSFPKITVINCGQIKISARRLVSLKHRHTGYLGHLKTERFDSRSNATRLTATIKGMLPADRRRSDRMSNLRCYDSNEPQ